MAAVRRLLRPVVRLLIRHGIGFPALVQALKPLFLAEARVELQQRGMAVTDSALTLLSGVHRRDVRRLTREAVAADAAPPPTALGPVAEIVGRWLTDAAWLDDAGLPRVLARSGEASFDALATAVSQDVRPRAMLDELLRLGVVQVDEGGVRLSSHGLAPRQGFRELSELFAANLHDHLAAAVSNLDGDSNFLEQALFVDQISAVSVQALEAKAREAWRQALRGLMSEARSRFDADAADADPQARTQRLRFGVYLYSSKEPMP